MPLASSPLLNRPCRSLAEAEAGTPTGRVDVTKANKVLWCAVFGLPLLCWVASR